MKNYIAFNTTNANWWDGKTFHAENPPLLITAPELAVLRATYENVVGTEVVVVPTLTEEEYAAQTKEHIKRLDAAIERFESSRQAKHEEEFEEQENQEIDLDGGLSAINE